MKRITWLALAFLVLLFGYVANAQVTNLTVNGVSSNFTMVQGDTLKWEYNLPVGGSAEGELWIDLNGNGVIDPASDKQLFGTFTQTDGQSGDPGDMDGLVNGHILFAMGNFGIAQSVAGTVTALPSPTYTVSGVVAVPSGISGQNIYVSAQGKNGQWGALTDATGNYTINFNAAAGGLQWNIQPQDQIPPYSQPAQINITLTGNLTGINFTYAPPAATVDGYLKGEDGHVFANVGIYSNPQNGGNNKNATTDANGYFKFGYSSSEISSNPIWSIQANSDGVAPAYFPPKINAISLHPGDNFSIDLTAYFADDSITGKVTLDGQAPGGVSFSSLFAYTDSGQTNANTDPNTGNFTLHVTNRFSNYQLGIANLPQNYGYDRNIPQVQPGDKNVIINVVTLAWLPQTSNTSNSLKSVSFVNSTTGWVAGSNGTMLKTTDAGVSWSSQTANTSNNINGISFFSTSTGWFVGDVGIIKKTTDGGGSWNSQNSTTSADLQAVQFIDANFGWAVGGSAILKTTNGGTTWTSQNPGYGQLNSLSMVSSSIGWVVGNGVILKTTDGGANWNYQYQPSNPLYSVHFADANSGGAVGTYGYTYSTTDGGTNWTPQPNFIGNFRCMCGVNYLTVWVVGDNANIYKSTNGGSTWTKQLTNINNNNLNAVQFVDANNGWAVGDNGWILHTSCGGAVTSVLENRSDELLRGFSLSQNYPNPFNPTTVIDYQIATRSLVSLRVYDLLGREIATLVNEEKSPGMYKASWDANTVSSGVYFYRITAGTYSVTKKLVLMK
jgi:photosystem II stability/assembly factor-like uncharacterized protein